MSATGNTMLSRKIFSSFAIFLMSMLCFSCGMQHKTVSPEIRSQMLDDLREGRLTLRCKIDCDFTWLQNYPSMAKMHNTGMWEDLAILVMQIGLENGPSYFFLGKAADGLGYYESAVKYYNYSLAMYRDPNALNHCKGTDRPGFCGDLEYEYEIPLLIGDATKKRDALLHPTISSPAPPPAPEPQKKKPDPTVKAAQEYLAKLGYDPGTPDGMMGKKTKEAIRQFQANNNLEITGKLSNEIMALLKNPEAIGYTAQEAVAAPSSSESVESEQTAPPQSESILPQATATGDTPKTDPVVAKKISDNTASSAPPPEKTDSKPSLSGNESGPESTSAKTEPATPPPPPTVIGHGTVTGPADALAKPKFSADVVTSIPNGTRVDILGEEGDFYKISYQGKEVFINSMFISK